ncbi:MAG: hypothetical protein JWP03_3868 [Phycisphaerales bacterium]|nr:hypothetical protein [Phycisphaerales bacterium]
MNEPYLRLSDEGERRRENILAIAHREAGRIRHRRAVRRIGIAAIAIGLTAALAMQSRRWGASREIVQVRPDQHDPMPPVVGPVAPPVQRRAVAVRPPKEIVITVVKTDPGIARRLSVKPPTTGWERIDDERLLAELAAAHRPAGLAYVDGREVVLFRTSDGGAEWRIHRPFR